MHSRLPAKETYTHDCILGRDKQKLDLDRKSKVDTMDNNHSGKGVLRTNIFCQISLKSLHANARWKNLNN